MRRHALFAILVVVLALLTIGAPAGATGGVPAGTPVIVRANPDNAIVGAARRAAATAGLGPVSPVGFCELTACMTPS